MKKSRWGIYLALKECGVDTSLGLRGKRKEETKIDTYLDTKWLGEDIGRSPTKIASLLEVKVAKVHLCLKNRRNTLIALALRMPFEYVLNDGQIVDWYVDPYRMIAHFHGEREGKEVEIKLNKLDLMAILRKMQDTPTDVV